MVHHDRGLAFHTPQVFCLIAAMLTASACCNLAPQNDCDSSDDCDSSNDRCLVPYAKLLASRTMPCMKMHRASGERHGARAQGGGWAADRVHSRGLLMHCSIQCSLVQGRERKADIAPAECRPYCTGACTIEGCAIGT